MITVIRPFVSELFAAVYADHKATGAPRGCVCVKMVAPAMHWLAAFFSKQVGALSREYHLSIYVSQGPQVDICLDASPWGLGGYLMINQKIERWFATRLSEAEMEI